MVRGPWPVARGPWPVARGPWPVVRGLFGWLSSTFPDVVNNGFSSHEGACLTSAEGVGTLTTDHGPRTTDHGPRTTGYFTATTGSDFRVFSPNFEW
jgi:hypothetical protein